MLGKELGKLTCLNGVIHRTFPKKSTTRPVRCITLTGVMQASPGPGFRGRPTARVDHRRAREGRRGKDQPIEPPAGIEPALPPYQGGARSQRRGLRRGRAAHLLGFVAFRGYLPHAARLVDGVSGPKGAVTVLPAPSRRRNGRAPSDQPFRSGYRRYERAFGLHCLAVGGADRVSREQASPLIAGHLVFGSESEPNSRASLHSTVRQCRVDSARGPNEPYGTAEQPAGCQIGSQSLGSDEACREAHPRRRRAALVREPLY